MAYHEKISKAHNVKKVLPIYQIISEALSRIDTLNYVKIYNGRIKASNRISENGKKEPIVEIGGENIIGVELLIDIEMKTIQFYSITSSLSSYGERMVASIVNSVPKEWDIVILMDWSGGFWNVMSERYPRLKIL